DEDGYWEIILPDYTGSSTYLYWGSVSGWSDKSVDTLSSTTNPFGAPVIIGSGESARSE
ncbi:MAG: hypothetical protein ACI8S6_005093, partial [Myxococcota bacterium]